MKLRHKKNDFKKNTILLKLRITKEKIQCLKPENARAFIQNSVVQKGLPTIKTDLKLKRKFPWIAAFGQCKRIKLNLTPYWPLATLRLE